MSTPHGVRADGSALSDVDVELLAVDAESSSAASVESVRLDQELKRDLLLRAAEDGTSVSDLIRAAVRQYLRAGEGISSQSAPDGHPQVGHPRARDAHLRVAERDVLGRQAGEERAAARR